MNPIRNSAKAIIIRNEELLAIEARDDDGLWYLLPGGGQDPGETLIKALIRECHEEIGTRVSPGDLIYVREYIGKNHEFVSTDSNSHQIEFMFACTISEVYIPKTGHSPDVPQIGVRWLPIKDLMSYRLYPLSLRSVLMESSVKTFPVYLGDVN